MKKNKKSKKLSIRREVVRELDEQQKRDVAGAAEIERDPARTLFCPPRTHTCGWACTVA